MTLYLVTFDLHGADSPPGDLYTSIYREIQGNFGPFNFCKDFGQFCLVVTDASAAVVKDTVREIIDRKNNRFSSRDIAVISLGSDISITRGVDDEDLRDFRRFFSAANR